MAKAVGVLLVPGIGSFRPGKRGEERDELPSKTDPVLIAWRRQLGKAAVADRYVEVEGRPVRIVSVNCGGTSVEYEFSVACWRSALHRVCVGNKLGHWLRAWAWILVRFPIVLALVIGPDLRDLPESRRWGASRSWRWWQVRRGLHETVRSFPYGSLVRFVLLTTVIGALAGLVLSGSIETAVVGRWNALPGGCRGTRWAGTRGDGGCCPAGPAARSKAFVPGRGDRSFPRWLPLLSCARRTSVSEEKGKGVEFVSIGSGLRPVHILSCLRSTVKASCLPVVYWWPV